MPTSARDSQGRRSRTASSSRRVLQLQTGQHAVSRLRLVRCASRRKDAPLLLRHPGCRSRQMQLRDELFERCDLYNLRRSNAVFAAHSSTLRPSRRCSPDGRIDQAFFDKCNFSFADLSGLQLQSCEFLSCKFSEASFIDTDLSNATMLACAWIGRVGPRQSCARRTFAAPRFRFEPGGPLRLRGTDHQPERAVGNSQAAGVDVRPE